MSSYRERFKAVAALLDGLRGKPWPVYRGERKKRQRVAGKAWSPMRAAVAGKQRYMPHHLPKLAARGMQHKRRAREEVVA